MLSVNRAAFVTNLRRNLKVVTPSGKLLTIFFVLSGRWSNRCSGTTSSLACSGWLGVPRCLAPLQQQTSELLSVSRHCEFPPWEFVFYANCRARSELTRCLLPLARADPKIEEAVANAQEYGAGNSVAMTVGTPIFFVPTKVVDEVRLLLPIPIRGSRGLLCNQSPPMFCTCPSV